MTPDASSETDRSDRITGPEQRLRRRPVALVTGLSGAGRATALRALEDLGWVAVDNMPLPLLDAALRPAADGADGDRFPAAFGIDVRTRGFDDRALIGFAKALRRRPDLQARLAFLDCDNDVLLRRYSETRRPHPLAPDRPVIDGIVDERRRLAALRDNADLAIDTSALAPHDLKRLLAGHFAVDGQPGLRLAVMSFSYRRGLPREADLVFDVRFLRNPHYDPALKPLTGLDPAVQAHVAADPDFAAFFARLEGFVLPLLPRVEGEGKSYLTVALGCTGGRHRSVFVAEKLAMSLRNYGRPVELIHRDADIAPGPARAASATLPSMGTAR